MNDTRHRILEAIAEGPVSGPTLARRLDVSRAAVWNHVEALRAAGFDVESGDDGYRLASVPEFGGAAVEFGLSAPFEVEYHDTIDSTNRRARERATAGDRDVVVLADEQTGGRGRLDRPWASPSGGVWLSAVVRPAVPTAHVPAFTLAMAVAVTRSAREAGVDARIKWPNDVVVAGDHECESGTTPTPADRVDPDAGGLPERKLAGILTETQGEADRVSWVVVGAGVNANVAAADLPEGATSIEERTGEAVDRRVFTQRLLSEFDDLRGDLEGAVSAWREHASTLGRRVTVDTPGGTVEGTAVDVTFPGALVVDTGAEQVRVTAGDCEHLRPA